MRRVRGLSPHKYSKYVQRGEEPRRAEHRLQHGGALRRPGQPLRVLRALGRNGRSSAEDSIQTAGKESQEGAAGGTGD